MTGGYPAQDVERQKKSSELPDAAATADVLITQDGDNRPGEKPEPQLAELSVVIGTSKMAADMSFVRRIVNFSGKCDREVRSRLSMGDAGYEGANRLMHVALLDAVPVGWCSSSTCGWGGDGHWGALSVDPEVQGRGIASALVKAAERRLLDAGCESVQIEYRFMAGNPAKERLYAWYEGKLGFDGGPKCSGFRCCHKMLSEEAFRRQHAKTSAAAKDGFQVPAETQKDGKRARSSSADSSSSN